MRTMNTGCFKLIVVSQYIQSLHIHTQATPSYLQSHKYHSFYTEINHSLFDTSGSWARLNIKDGMMKY